MGLNAGLVPARVDAPAKQGLLDLIDHAHEQGFSGRWACRQLGLDHARMLTWQARARTGGDLADQAPGPPAGEALHALLDWEKSTITELSKTWRRVDLSHRKLAHRGSRLGAVFVAESTVLRVLTAAGMHRVVLRPPQGRAGNFSVLLQALTGIDENGRAHAARLRHELLCVPARLIRHGRRLTLRLPPGDQLLPTVLTRIRQLHPVA